MLISNKIKGVHVIVMFTSGTLRDLNTNFVRMLTSHVRVTRQRSLDEGSGSSSEPYKYKDMISKSLHLWLQDGADDLDDKVGTDYNWEGHKVINYYIISEIDKLFH